MKFNITDGRCWYKQVVSGLLMAIPASTATALLIGIIYLMANTFVGALVVVAVVITLTLSSCYHLVMFIGKNTVLVWYWATSER